MSERIALVIANYEFADPKLRKLVTPARDAEMLTELLSDPEIGGYKVTALINESLQELRREIAKLFQRRSRNDLLLLYYSGHGIRDESRDLYLAVKDTETDLVSATAISAEFVRSQIDKSDSQRKVVILDCCYSGAFAGAKASLGDSASTKEAFEGSGYGRVILTASNAIEYAWEGDKFRGEAETSVFTHFIVNGLQIGAADLDKDGEITISELYTYVHEQVRKSGYKQTPQMWSQEVEGQIAIAKNPHPVVESAELPSELQEAIESPYEWMRVGAVSGLEQLLHGKDQGLVLAANEALLHLTKDKSRHVVSAAARALGLSFEGDTVRPSSIARLAEMERSAPEVSSAPDAPRLPSLWNPLDHLRLLWWALARPSLLKSLVTNMSKDGQKQLKQQGSWQVNTLTWGPLFIISAWRWLSVMGLLPADSAFLSWVSAYDESVPLELQEISLGLMIVYVGAWSLIGRWGTVLSRTGAFFVLALAVPIAVITAVTIIPVSSQPQENVGQLVIGLGLALAISSVQSVAFGTQAVEVGIVGGGVALSFALAAGTSLMGGGAIEAGIVSIVLLIAASAVFDPQTSSAPADLVFSGVIIAAAIGGLTYLFTGQLSGSNLPAALQSILAGSVGCGLVLSQLVSVFRRHK